MQRKTRGVRNNNPGNIKAGKSRWQGQTGVDDKGFLIFDTPENGIRALAKLLLNYQRLHKCNTLRKIIDRYAPPVENPTSSYLDFVRQLVRVDPDARLSLARDRAAHEHLVRAIIRFENGYAPYPAAVIQAGLDAGRDGAGTTSKRKVKHAKTDTAHA